MQKTAETKGNSIESLFKAGAQFGFVKSRRHPSVKPFIFGTKNKTEIFDLEHTELMLEKAKAFVATLAAEGKTILFVGGKAEARGAVEEAAQSIAMPYVNSRWIGGTLTNFPEIKKRVEKLKTLTTEKERGELAKYTKKERILIDKEIEDLQKKYGGLGDMKDLPVALFVIDSKHEDIAVTEARKKGLTIVALCGSDCDLSKVDYPIVANDSARASINFFAKEIASVYKSAKK